MRCAIYAHRKKTGSGGAAEKPQLHTKGSDAFFKAVAFCPGEAACPAAVAFFFGEAGGSLFAWRRRVLVLPTFVFAVSLVSHQHVHQNASHKRTKIEAARAAPTPSPFDVVLV